MLAIIENIISFVYAKQFKTKIYCTMNIFVSSLSFKAKKEDLANLFAPYGEVTNARIILNKENHRSKGYGFVEMEDEEKAKAAIAALNGAEHMGRIINVAIANERPAKPVENPVEMQ
jgi:RNA recognition motif-containing protein